MERSEETAPQVAVPQDADRIYQPAAVSEMDAGGLASGTDVGEGLLPPARATDFQRRWEAIQATFVDEPRGAVEDADGLVASVMGQLAESFGRERERMEEQWDRGEQVSTEDLRVVLQRYRSFFQRLLST